MPATRKPLEMLPDLCSAGFQVRGQRANFGVWDEAFWGGNLRAGFEGVCLKYAHFLLCLLLCLFGWLVLVGWLVGWLVDGKFVELREAVLGYDGGPPTVLRIAMRPRRSKCAQTIGFWT